LIRCPADRLDSLPDLTDEPIIVRQAERDDVPEVLALWGAARSEHARTADSADLVGWLIESSPAALLVAERDGAIVGTVIAGWDGWRGNLYRLAVDPAQRRAGIGVALTRAGESHLRECGARRVTALVALEDGNAGAFWDAAGYPHDEEIGRRVRNI
jgi:ribosomal protein S18 acetylase RimI-like enzyme